MAAVALAIATGTRLRGRQLEEQELDREQDGSDRSRESSRHPCGGASHQKSRAFHIREMNPLCDQRAEGSASHNDRTLRAEGSARTDGDRR